MGSSNNSLLMKGDLDGLATPEGSVFCEAGDSVFGSNIRGRDFDERASDATVFGGADKEALFFGAVMIGLAERAATVCHEGCGPQSALGKSVVMTAKGGLQIVVFE